MLNCWEAALGAAVSVPVLLFVAAPYIRCVLPSAAPALPPCSAPRSCVCLYVRGGSANSGNPVPQPALRPGAIPACPAPCPGDTEALPGSLAPARSGPPAALCPGLCPGSGSGSGALAEERQGRGPRSPQGAAAQPIGGKAPARAAAANGSRGST